MQNWNRLPIISDTTRSYSVVLNPYGDSPEDIEIAGGYYIEERCPVRGVDLLPVRFDTAEEALAFLQEEMA